MPGVPACQRWPAPSLLRDRATGVNGPGNENTPEGVLERCLAQRATVFAAALDVTDVNRVVRNIAPHRLELHRSGGRT
jgi:hypothetical protein